MDAEWIKSPTGRRVLSYWSDPRPAWLWSADGRSLLWRNAAARCFNARIKKSGLKPGPEPVPIKGQVSRLMRLGSSGRSSLSRMRFLAGGKPVSATCTVTPLAMPEGEAALLIVGVDPVDVDVLAAGAGQAFDSYSGALFPRGAEYVLVHGGEIRDGSPRAREALGPLIGQQGEGVLPLPAGADAAEIELAGETLLLSRIGAGPQGATLLLLEGIEPEASATRIAAVRAEEGLVTFGRSPHGDAPERQATEPQPVAPPPLEAGSRQETGVEEEEALTEPPEPSERRSLSSLFDRLAGHEQLYAPLPPETSDGQSAAPARAGGEPDLIAAVIEFDEDEAVPPGPPAVGITYRVIGRGFRPAEAGRQPAAAPARAEPSTEVVERVSRYNFDELSRILADRVSADGAGPAAAAEGEPSAEGSGRAHARTADHALVNVAAETFILNRLPIGILVFRDQQVLFANRALTELVGYESVEAMRAAGLGAVFPSSEETVAGPVTHIVHRGGTHLPVLARLQSITWQGRPALMLSASAAEAQAGHDGVVRAFAETLASLRDEGFVSTDRAGVVKHVSARFAELLGGTGPDIVGKPLVALIEARSAAALRRFLEEPAKFAETARPSVEVACIAPRTSLLLFAEGQAGIVTGYFGLLRSSAGGEARRREDGDLEPSMLARVSRGLRRPLNTIIGFSDLIRTAAFGPVENQRYLEYARDINTAGQEIAALVDELDDIARLREGSYAARPAELDLGELLESCVLRVREQASAARVLVRSAISERLPRIRADGASLRQAVLNLMASAIDQTPPGGTVVLSSQPEDDGSIAVHVRDSGGRSTDPAERFVVFRDGIGKDGEALVPMRSSVGLALTRSLLAVNTCSLSVDPAGKVGTLFSLVIPADLVA